MMNIAKMLGGVSLALLLAACGGGGGNSGATTGGTGGTGGVSTGPVPASIEIFASSPQVSSAVGSSTSFTVVVKDASNQAIPDQTVTFSASSGNLSGALPAPKTGPVGEAITSVSLTPGTDQSNRNIVVTAKAGAITQTITIAVQGTAVSVAGDSAVLAGGKTTFTAKAMDSAGRALPGASLTITSSLGNGVQPATVVTDSQGAATFTYTGTKAGIDTLTVSGLGTTARASISVSADDFRFESPAANSGVVIGATQTVSVVYFSGGAPVVGRAVTFSTTRGSVSAESVLTDANGRASTIVSSFTSGPASVIAQVASAQATLPLVFVATTPASLVLQTNPSAVPPNAGGSTLNQAALEATVRDSSGNPVSGRVVNFSAVADGSNGTISPGSGITDANGKVVVQFIPGALTTANNGVVIRATVQGTTVAGNVVLTVSGQALFISIAAGNVISNLNVTTYQKEFSVYVTDANGAPAANKEVKLSVFPDFYAKGDLRYNGTAWTYRVTPTWCLNEDLNRNGIVDPNEDGNGNGRLDPGLPVVVAPASVTTASNGFATFFLQFGENFVPWIQTTITARATVGGTESTQSAIYPLEGLASDFTSETVPPQGQTSPLGTAPSCQASN